MLLKCVLYRSISWTALYTWTTRVCRVPVDASGYKGNCSSFNTNQQLDIPRHPEVSFRVRLTDKNWRRWWYFYGLTEPIKCALLFTSFNLVGVGRTYGPQRRLLVPFVSVDHVRLVIRRWSTIVPSIADICVCLVSATLLVVVSLGRSYPRKEFGRCLNKTSSSRSWSVQSLGVGLVTLSQIWKKIWIRSLWLIMNTLKEVRFSLKL